MTNAMTVRVTGATGKQGGWVTRALAGKGHRLRAMTRRPDSPESRELKKLGVEVVSANFDDRLSVERAARAADVVFAMSTPFEAGPAVEVSQSFGLLRACQSAGVKHIVYCSAAGADRRTGIPHFESKFQVEQHLSTLGLGYRSWRRCSSWTASFRPGRCRACERDALRWRSRPTASSR